MNDQNVIVGKRSAISNWIRKFSTEVLFRENKYRLKESVLGVFKWSKELLLPKIDYVLVFKHVFAKCEACSTEEYENNIHAYFQVSLVHHNIQRIVVHETKNLSEAMLMAGKLSEELHTPLRDRTQKRTKTLGSNPTH